MQSHEDWDRHVATGSSMLREIGIITIVCVVGAVVSLLGLMLAWLLYLSQ